SYSNRALTAMRHPGTTSAPSSVSTSVSKEISIRDRYTVTECLRGLTMITYPMLPRGSLFLAGVPATGKSSFGNWLEAQKGYFHLDFDEEDIVEQRGFGQAQDLLWHHNQAEPLLHALIARHQPIVLTWGFATHFLPIVKQLLTWGFLPVWF